MALELHAFPDFGGRPAAEILEWAVSEFFPDIAVACSMQDAVVVDLAWKVEPRIEVFFLETDFHFSETLETAQKIRERYDLNLVALKPVENPAVYDKEGYDACCRSRKVLPLEAYLSTKRAWVSGIRRVDAKSREVAKEVEWDAGRELVKVNPIIAWTDEDVGNYISENDVIVNPLRYRGFESIGCRPCTRSGRGREGRWSGADKDECGIHLAEPSLHRPGVGE